LSEIWLEKPAGTTADGTLAGVGLLPVSNESQSNRPAGCG
jgi:hypothetical protein